MITDIRLHSQQFVNPQYDNPKELVKWMGAVQAQQYNMAKWALGIRTKEPTILEVEEALAEGFILRLHILRPTWHFVAAEDVRWMLTLCRKRLHGVYNAWGKQVEITEDLSKRCNKLIERALEGKSLTKEELGSVLAQNGLTLDSSRINWFLMKAEIEGIICSGVDKGNKVTYALLDERVPTSNQLHKEEALGELAKRYFQSHSPASLEDFIWWSGLSITEAKQAVNLIHSQLIEENFDSKTFFTHQSFKDIKGSQENILHFLPSYDEYLISYKNRTMAIHPDNYPKAFNNYGIFYPIIMYNGKIVGNWKKINKKGKLSVETSFFDKSFKIAPKLLKQAEKRYIDFWNKTI